MVTNVTSTERERERESEKIAVKRKECSLREKLLN